MIDTSPRRPDASHESRPIKRNAWEGLKITRNELIGVALVLMAVMSWAAATSK